MRNEVVLFLLLTGCASTGGGVHVENDWLTLNNGDKYYTHGTKFDYTPNEEEIFSLGQNIFTPSSKKADVSPELLRKDRPYSGWLYGEYRRSVVDSSDVYTTYGLQGGCVGSCSFAKETQREVHRLIGQGLPAWPKSDTQVSEPGFIAEYEKRKRIYGNDYSDGVVYGLGKFGNIIDSASIGTTFRLGYGLSDTFLHPIVFKTNRDPGKSWGVYLFSTLEERGVLYNHLLSGSLFQDEPHRVSEEPFVDEIDLGFALRYREFVLAYHWTRFSPEWKENPKSFTFGGISLEW